MQARIPTSLTSLPVDLIIMILGKLQDPVYFFRFIQLNKAIKQQLEAHPNDQFWKPLFERNFSATLFQKTKVM